MGAVALDLTPIVDRLLEHPFDKKTLDAASAAVGGHAHAYATALRCAAKRADDPLAAAYFLSEAARVHESVDDLGGAIALLWRARECDAEDPRTSELLAACMTRLALRAGLSFTFTPTPGMPQSGAESEGLRRRESGLRPAAAARPRDTLPDLFGLDSPEAKRDGEEDTLDGDWSLERPSPVTLVPPTLLTGAPSELSETPPGEVRTAPSEAPESIALPPLESAALAPPESIVFPLSPSRRVATILPPQDPDVAVTPLPSPAQEPVLRAIAELAMSKRSPETVPPPSSPPSSVPSRSSRPLSTLRARVLPAAGDVYGEPVAPRTERPVGERLVGELFETLHALHFSDDVRSGSAFLARVLEEKMRPSTVLVHVYDINSRHFVVMSAAAARAEALLDYATPEDDPFIAEVMKEEEATLVLDPKDDSRLLRGRWLLAEPKRSVLCAPVVLEGRYLGLIEVADPLDGSEFTEDDRNALTYAASAFARFLDKLGVVLSEDGADLDPATNDALQR